MMVVARVAHIHLCFAHILLGWDEANGHIQLQGNVEHIVQYFQKKKWYFCVLSAAKLFNTDF